MAQREVEYNGFASALPGSNVRINGGEPVHVQSVANLGPDRFRLVTDKGNFEIGVDATVMQIVETPEPTEPPNPTDAQRRRSNRHYFGDVR